MIEMISITDLQEKGFTGNGQTLSESLREYGVAWVSVNNDQYKLIYGINLDEVFFTLFSETTVNRDLINKITNNEVVKFNDNPEYKFEIV